MQPGHQGKHVLQPICHTTCLAPQTSEHQGRTEIAQVRMESSVLQGELILFQGQGGLTTSPWITPLQGLMPSASVP